MSRPLLWLENLSAFVAKAAEGGRWVERTTLSVAVSDRTDEVLVDL
jgi:hypothetical protein